MFFDMFALQFDILDSIFIFCYAVKQCVKVLSWRNVEMERKL